MFSPARSDPAPALPPVRARRLVGAVERWFAKNARDFPWRTEPRDAYVTLVSELMLQQTQASRVAERLPEFLGRFPTARALARADEAEVLAAWAGLGYYRRARLLHGAAKAIADEHAGSVPDDPGLLRALPGVGPYTAGAIASIAFGRPEPAVDGNVARVLARLEARPGATGDAALIRWAEGLAGALMGASSSPGALAEGLIELGATVCTPRAPRCGSCPVRADCRAFQAGSQASIPAPKRAATRRVVYCGAVVAVRADGAVLLERRPDTGLWAGMWQSPTVERTDRAPTPDEARAHAGARRVERAGAFTHLTTHREVRFEVWRGTGARATGGRRYAPADALDAYAQSSAQRRVLRIGTSTMLPG